MLGRPMRTTLDLLRPSPKPDFQPQLSGKRSFSAGSKVFAKVYSSNENWKWMPGTILEAIGSVSYNVLLDCQVGRRKVLRSHVDQLRSRMEEAVPVEPAPLSILIDDFGLSANEATQPRRSESPAVVPDQQSFPEETVESSVVVPEETLSIEEDETLLPTENSLPIQTSTPVQPVSRRPERSIRPPRRLADFHCYQLKGGDATMATRASYNHST
nr:uncharacterized protein LOC115269109 [Aedes albopictus]